MKVTATKTHRPSRPRALSALELLEHRVVLAADLMSANVAPMVEEVEIADVDGDFVNAFVNAENTDGDLIAARFADPGDFNNDGMINAVDIDLLTTAITSRAVESVYDLTLDGVVDMDDMDMLIRDIIHTEYGDADLDGQVDMVDFWMMYRNMYTDSGGWTRGDYNLDGQIDGSDFSVWNQHKNFSRPTAIESPTTPSPVQTELGSEDETATASDSSTLQENPVTSARTDGILLQGISGSKQDHELQSEASRPMNIFAD